MQLAFNFKKMLSLKKISPPKHFLIAKDTFIRLIACLVVLILGFVD